MEVKIQIPDNCELIKDGDTYIVKEKKNDKPRSWEEFCDRYPKKSGETFIGSMSEIFVYDIPSIRDDKRDKNVCTSKQEAEAFLALMQLRQLRKAWVGDWDQKYCKYSYFISVKLADKSIITDVTNGRQYPLSFPNKEMAEEFLDCFKDLCETAKILL